MAPETLFIFQLLLTYIVLYFLIPRPSEFQFTYCTFAAGIFTCLTAGALHFIIAGCLEMVAFWQDIIWNLMVMLRFGIILLGGGMIPLEFFPTWGKTLVHYTPFPLLVNFPAQVFLGTVSFSMWTHQILLLLIWIFVFLVLACLLWKRGLLQYTGVGI